MSDERKRDPRLWRGEEWPAVADAGEAPSGTFHPAGKRVLIVDDQPEIRELADMVLGAEGYLTVTAEDGYEAIARLTESVDPFDLVLLDINMPEQDGWETLRVIRGDDALSDLRVVMFSVKGEVRDKMHSLQEGANDYLAKPFEIEALVEKVRSQFAAEDP